ncbi:MAG: Crp/Fnr family transcriptional regulator [Chitinophagales bacterium]
MLDKLRENFPQLSDKWDEYVSYYHRMEVPAGTILLREGEVSKKAYMIEKGCVRVWFNNNGKDTTFQFMFENEFVSSAESFRKSIPSFFTMETIEPSVLHWIHKKDLDKIFSDINELQDMRNNMVNIAFERQYHYMRHFLSFIKDKPEQRYLNLLKEQPHIIQRVPQHYIATYLGITPVSLSRIRKRLGK